MVKLDSFEGQVRAHTVPAGRMLILAGVVQAAVQVACQGGTGHFGGQPEMSQQKLRANLREPSSLTELQRPLLWLSKAASPSVFQE